MFHRSIQLSTKWLSIVYVLAFTVTACSDSTDPTKSLHSSYALATIDDNPVPFIYYENQDIPEFPVANRYVTRTIEHISADTFVVSELLDVIRPTDNTTLGFQCSQHTGTMQRKGRYVIFKYYVQAPVVPGVGGIGSPIPLEARYDTLTVEGDELIQIATAIPGRISRLVFKPGVALASCPTPPTI